MSWAIDVYSITGSLEQTALGSADPPGLIGGFRALVNAAGLPVDATFGGVQTVLAITGRKWIRIRWNDGVTDHTIFQGVIENAPHPGTNGAGSDSTYPDALERFLLVGGARVLQDTPTAELLIEGTTDIEQAMLDVLTASGPPGVVLDIANFAATARVIDAFYKPRSTLASAVEDIAAAAQGFFAGVDSERRFVLTAGTANLTVAYADCEIEPLPVDFSNATTRVELVIAGNQAGEAPRIIDSSQGLANNRVTDYVPWPVVHAVEDASHAANRATKTFAVPEGVNPFLQGSDIDESAFSLVQVERFNEALTNPPQYRDGVAGGALTVDTDGINPALINFVVDPAGVYADRVYGWLLRYEGDFDPEGSGGAWGVYTWAKHDATAASGLESLSKIARVPVIPNTGISEMYLVFPRDVHAHPLNRNDPGAYTLATRVILWIDPLTVSSTFTLHEFYPLILNTALLNEIATGMLRLPGSTPQRVTVWNQRLAPAKTYTITGYPGGDLTLPVKDLEYVLDDDGFRTIITLDTTTGEVSEAALEQYVQAVAEKAGYAVKLGERG